MVVVLLQQLLCHHCVSRLSEMYQMRIRGVSLASEEPAVHHTVQSTVRGRVHACVHYLSYYLHSSEHCARHCARPLRGNGRMAACSALAANSAAQGVCKRHARHCAPPLRGEVRGPWRQQRPAPGCAGFHAHPLRHPVRGLVHSPWALNLPRMTPCTDLCPCLAQHLRRTARCIPAAHRVLHPSVHKAKHNAVHASLRRP